MGIEYMRMEPPYIFIEEINGKILVLTVDEEDNPVTAVAAQLNTFLDNFINLFKKHYPEKSKEVLELEIGSRESVESSMKAGSSEASKGEVTGEGYSSVKETLKGFESGEHS